MIELFVTGPMFGQPDPSPFVGKALLLLKMANIPFKALPMRFRDAPKGKIPYIRVANGFLGDSFFIARHLEDALGADFSGGYSASQLTQGWAVSRMMEEHLYYIIVCDRWLNAANFNKGPAHFFDGVPHPARALVRGFIQRKVKKMLHGQGMGRHSDSERTALAKGDVDSVEALLGGKPYLLGDVPCEHDASAFAFLFAAATSHFDSRVGDDIRRRPALMAYLERIRSAHFPECGL